MEKRHSLEFQEKQLRQEHEEETARLRDNLLGEKKSAIESTKEMMRRLSEYEISAAIKNVKIKAEVEREAAVEQAILGLQVGEYQSTHCK